MPPQNSRDQYDRRYQEPQDRIRWEPLYPPDEPPAERSQQVPPQRAVRGGNAGRLIALLMLAAAAVIAWWFYPSIALCFARIGTIPDRPNSHDPFVGFVAFGLCLVTIVAVVKIIVEGQRRR